MQCKYKYNAIYSSTATLLTQNKSELQKFGIQMFPVFKCPVFRSPLYFKLDNSLSFSINFEHFFSRSPDEARKKPFDSKSVYNVDTDVDVDTDADVDVEKMKQKS